MFSIAIEKECNGLYEFFVLSSFILSSWEFPVFRRLIWVVISFFLIFVLNFLRLSFIVFLMRFNFELVDIVHNFTFKFFLFFAIFGVYYFFVKYEKNRSRLQAQS